MHFFKKLDFFFPFGSHIIRLAKKAIIINSYEQTVIILSIHYFFLCPFFQGFFKDMLTVNNPNISPQRIEDYVNGAVSFKI